MSKPMSWKDHLPTCKCPPCLAELQKQQKRLRQLLGDGPMMDEAIASAELAKKK